MRCWLISVPVDIRSEHPRLVDYPIFGTDLPTGSMYIQCTYTYIYMYIYYIIHVHEILTEKSWSVLNAGQSWIDWRWSRIDYSQKQLKNWFNLSSTFFFVLRIKLCKRRNIECLPGGTVESPDFHRSDLTVIRYT